ncbi:hypothetical protein [Ornithinibacillus xuwenensis]|uniref:Uncharacterized protein n=1 Tax=Ornithinibacillus xuwenensis TaxID=3144668 RepID=A0ABU9XHT3_9BACI
MPKACLKKTIGIITCFLLFLLVTNTVLAAMDPTEIEQINRDAPYHIIGTVTSDELYSDVTKDQEHPIQLRKMTIHITDVIKAPNNMIGNRSVDVFYHYIPAWDAKNYNGGKRMDIAKEDVIEIWLEEGDNGWEPAISGDSVHHIRYQEDRSEHIEEPFWNAFTRKLSSLDSIQTDAFVIIGLLIVLIWACYRGLRKTT